MYTSGKGSSAAGLTATVVKDAHGEFFLEASQMHQSLQNPRLTEFGG